MPFRSHAGALPGYAPQHQAGTMRGNSPHRAEQFMATIDTRVFSIDGARNATVRSAEASDVAEVLAFRKTVADETEFLMGAADEIRHLRARRPR